MTTLEHLFMQIFDRKAWIEGQLRQQVESYSQSLAYNLLADGGRPPSWLLDVRPDAPACPDPKEWSREQLIQGILFPHPWATTPSASHNSIYTLPAPKSTNMSQYSSYVNEICISKECVCPEHIDVVMTTSHNKDDARDCGMACSEVVEDTPDSDLLASNYCYRSRQKDPENHLNKKSNAANSGDENIVEQYQRRVTRSMAASLTSNHAEGPSAMKNSLAPHTKGGDGAAPSGMATQSLDCLENISKPSSSSGFIINNAIASEAIFVPTTSQKSDDLIVNATHGASVRECCTGAVEKEFVSNGSNYVDPGLKATLSAASRLSHNQSLVVMKKLSFDGIEICHLEENPCDSFSQKENLCCSLEGSHKRLKSVQSLNENPLYKDFACGSGAVQLEEDALNNEVMLSAEVSGSGSTEKGKKKSQSHPPSTSNSHQNFEYNIGQGSPSGSLIGQSMQQQSGKPITSRRPSIPATMQFQSSDVKPMHCDLNKGCTTSLEKEARGSNAEISFSESFQPIKDEEFHGKAKTMLVSCGKEQLQLEDVLPATEVMREEAKRVSGKDHVRAREESVDVVGTVESRFCGKISSHVPAMGSMEMVCTTDSCKKFSDESLVEHKIKGSRKRKLVKKSVCSLDSLTDVVQSGGSALLTHEFGLETEEIEFVTVESGGRLGCPLLTNSAATSDVSRSDGSSFPCSHDHSVLLISKESDGTTRDVPEKILAEKSLTVAEIEKKKKTRGSYFLRSSTSAQRDVGHCKVNACISPSPEKTMLLETNTSTSPSLRKTKLSETKEDENCENVMDAAQKSIPYNVTAQNHPSEPQYLLRSLNRHGNAHVCSEPNGTSNATSSKRSRKVVTNACEISWPKRRKLNNYSDSILATSPRIRLRQLHDTQVDKCYSRKRSSESASLEEVQTTPSPSRTMLNIDITNSEVGSHSEAHCQIQKQCVIEVQGDSCLKIKDQILDISLSNQHKKLVRSPNLAHGNSDTCQMNEYGNIGSTLLKLKEPGISGEDTIGDLNYVVSKGYCYGLQSTKESKVFDAGRGLSTYDASVLSNLQYGIVDCDESMPEFEGFSIGVSPTMESDICYDSDYPCFWEERISLDAQRGSSKDLVTPKACSSGNYKINKLPDAFQSLPTGLLEHMNSNDSIYFHGDYIRQFGASEHDKMSDLYSSLGSVFDSSFVERSYSHSTPSSGARFGWTASKPPLTPPIEKSSLRKVSGKSGASSQTLGSNPELVCFRIDENSSTVEDNEHPDKVGTSEEGICSRGIKVLDDREPLRDITSICENASTSVPLTKTLLERGSLEILNPKSSSGNRISVDSCLGSAYTSNTDQIGDKENQCLSVNGNKEGKVVKSLCNRSSKPEINVKAVGRNNSQASIQKGCMPNNIISNISSFIPMVRKKQQATATKAKKEIKVKALEVAEAAKRLEEKKQNEREMRKAAAKLERERLEQEKQLKQKQLEEEKRRKEAEIATRKRQREEEERKEKERKRRCIEEARKLQREQEERLHAKKEEKEFRCKAADDDGRKKCLVQAAKQQLKSEKGGEVAGTRKAQEANLGATKAVISSDGMKGIVQDRMSTTKEIQDCQSYEISPYKDSDDEDGEEDNIRRRKYIPSWARRECLDQILLSQQQLDPLKIFCHKSCFSLSEVLLPSVARRRPF